MQNMKLHFIMKPLNRKLYDIARTKMNFNDDDAMEFVSSIHELNDHRFENLVTKEFLSEKINGINSRFNIMENSFSDTKFELIKWMFIFWASQMTITIGIILLFIKN